MSVDAPSRKKAAGAELQCDWARAEMAEGVGEIVLTERLLGT